jgi:hypothetical protein
MLLARYQEKLDYYYREVPVNRVLCLDEAQRVCGMYRLKRPRRIAEKTQRKLARWLFAAVQSRARAMAETRARERSIPLVHLLTPSSDTRRAAPGSDIGGGGSTMHVCVADSHRSWRAPRRHSPSRSC